ncbi:response regulator [Terrimonas sp. NA20]|uniref:Response regulator n=1 Tax=Terrimonas ginsenosidimutans TaxID=2908004 RepID=A0ABS9KY06_9BACT|nr:response regulator [Terrimonas ginsenosidimutans]MCG2617109.1 response regulator [Terrimonas ginsenosidimutans]
MSKKIIIYDDDMDLLEVCALILTAKNFEVVIRDKCTEIIDDIATHKPDVILMDNWIPDIGGVKATRLVKNSAEFSHIPVIFFTANNNVTELAAEAGADYSLQKPFDISELETIVTEAVNKKA